MDDDIPEGFREIRVTLKLEGHAGHVTAGVPDRSMSMLELLPVIQEFSGASFKWLNRLRSEKVSQSHAALAAALVACNWYRSHRWKPFTWLESLMRCLNRSDLLFDNGLRRLLSDCNKPGCWSN
jgi:hypothetical protein